MSGDGPGAGESLAVSGPEGSRAAPRHFPVSPPGDPPEAGDGPEGNVPPCSGQRFQFCFTALRSPGAIYSFNF